MEIEILLRIVFSLIFVCSLAALTIIFVLPRFYKQGFAEDSPLKINKKIRLDFDNTLLILNNKDHHRLVFLSSKQGISMIGSLDSEDKFIALDTKS